MCTHTHATAHFTNTDGEKAAQTQFNSVPKRWGSTRVENKVEKHKYTRTLALTKEGVP